MPACITSLCSNATDLLNIYFKGEYSEMWMTHD